jgi:hypothetical protein
VADRGLREGILATLMAEDGHGFSPRNRHGPWQQGTPAPRGLGGLQPRRRFASPMGARAAGSRRHPSATA